MENKTGSESYKFVNGETISVCCADVSSSDNREFKDCIQYVSKDMIGNYHVSWEKKNGRLIKILEEVIWQGYNCLYYFDETGEWTRQCDGIKGDVKEPRSLEKAILECDNKGDVYARDGCYEDIAMEFGDSSVCFKISDKLSSGWCSEAVVRINDRIKIIIEEKDPSICEEGLSADEDHYCYFMASKELNDPLICDFIDDVYFPREC